MLEFVAANVVTQALKGTVNEVAWEATIASVPPTLDPYNRRIRANVADEMGLSVAQVQQVLTEIEDANPS